VIASQSPVLDHRGVDEHLLKSVALKVVSSDHRRVGSYSSHLLWTSTKISFLVCAMVTTESLCVARGTRVTPVGQAAVKTAASIRLDALWPQWLLGCG
jgi:hypothetical protein